MIKDYYPWMLDIDTAENIDIHTYIDTASTHNNWFKQLTIPQQQFFSDLGLSTKHIYYEHLPNLPTIVIKFLLKGHFIEMPSMQKAMYEEVFGVATLSKVKSLAFPEQTIFSAFKVDDMYCRFKHPGASIDEITFSQWECGYILGHILMKSVDH